MTCTATDTYSAVISIRLLTLIWDDCGHTGHEMLPVRTHGAASGVLSMIGGGNFGSGFVLGAVASGIGSIPHSSDGLRLVKLVSGSAAGGLVAYALGGRFIQGAIQGLKIGFFNHYVHDTRLHKELMQDANGNLYGELAEFVYEGEYTGPTETSSALAGGWISFETLSFSNMIIDNIGKGLKKGGNSTIGNNGKFYFHPEGERGFYGNQSVKALKLTTIGRRLSKFAGPIGWYLDWEKVKEARLKDSECLRIYGKNDDYYYNKARGEIAGGRIYGYIGFSAGVYGGTPFGPLGMVIVGAALGIEGSIMGEEMGAQFVDAYYRENNLFIP